jgi:hypothetical protein
MQRAQSVYQSIELDSQVGIAITRTETGLRNPSLGCCPFFCRTFTGIDSYSASTSRISLYSHRVGHALVLELVMAAPAPHWVPTPPTPTTFPKVRPIFYKSYYHASATSYGIVLLLILFFLLPLPPHPSDQFIHTVAIAGPSRQSQAFLNSLRAGSRSTCDE